MLDHVEKIFADMKPMMKKLKKASYKVNMEAFIEIRFMMHMFLRKKEK